MTHNPKFFYGFVFITGAAVMMLEFAVSRIIAPWFGTSIFVWGNVIGVILIALSLGYYYGGKLADRMPHTGTLMNLTLAAGIFTAVIPIIVYLFTSQIPLLSSINSSSFIISIFGSFISVILLCTIPIVLLGMVSPYAIRLATHTVESTGQIAGGLYAASTLGSIIGTFGSAFFLVPFLGSRETIILSSIVLIVVACIGERRWWPRLAYIGIPIIVYVLFAGTLLRANASVVAEIESHYQFIQVVDEGDYLALQFNEGLGTQSYFMKEGVLTGQYFDYISLVPELTQTTAPNVLVLGLAGGTVTREIDHYIPQATITGVEIDPKVIELAQQHFQLDDQRTTVYIDDARSFVRKVSATTDTKYNTIIIDAYTNEIYIPWHLTTQEFYEELNAVLAPDGIIAFNMGSTTDQTALFQSVLATLRATFEHVVVVPVPDTLNYIVLASHQDVALNTLSKIANDSNDERSAVAKKFKRSVYQPTITDQATILTDNRAPIEFYTEGMIADYIINGFQR